MDVLDLMDALQVHAAAAAVTAGGVTFSDVAVGFPAARGRCVRIFYGGEREVEHFTEQKVLNAQLMAEAVIVRGYWPLSETAKKRQRIMEQEIAVFVKDFRTRVLADSQLGGEAVDLNLNPAVCEQVIYARTKYAVVDLEAVCDFSEYPIAP